MVWARILELILRFLGVGRVRGLWYWLWDMFGIIRWVIILSPLIFPRIFDSFIRLCSRVSWLLFVPTFRGVWIWRCSYWPCNLRFPPPLQMAIYFLQLQDTRTIQLRFLPTFPTRKTLSYPIVYIWIPRLIFHIMYRRTINTRIMSTRKHKHLLILLIASHTWLLLFLLWLFEHNLNLFIYIRLIQMDIVWYFIWK